MSNLKKLPRIIHQCMTIGGLPSSYKLSLTYEEQLMWFCKFLETEIIPTVNNNSEVVEELKHYLENLDVQEEINTKLEEMAEDGTLAEIINQEIFGEINDKVTKLQNDLQEFKIIVDDFKEESDEDDTASIERAIEYAKDFENPTLVFTNGEYHISDYFEIDFKLNIDFNGATIYFENNEIDESGDAKAIFWYTTSNIVEYSSIASELNENTNIFQADVQNTNINDFLVLKFNENGTGELSSEHYYLSQVKNINSNNFTLDFILGFDFNTFGYTAQLGKPRQVLKDIYVKNGTIIDISETTNDNSTVNAITFNGFFVNTSIENMKLYNMGCHGINLRHTYNTTVKNVIINNTRVHDAGHGYGIRLQANSNLVVNNLKGGNLRHLIDFTMDFNSLVENCECIGADASYSSHGQYEYILRLKNIISKQETYSLALGDSNYSVTSYFMQYTKNVIVENAEFYGRLALRGANNITLKNCEVNYTGSNHFLALTNNITFENCKIKNNIQCYNLKYSNSNVPREIHNRVLNKMTFNNCELTYVYTPTTTQSHEGIIEIKNCIIYPQASQSHGLGSYTLIYDDNKFIGSLSADNVLHLNGVNLEFKNNEINNSMRISIDASTVYCNFENNNFINNRADYTGYLITFLQCALKHLSITGNYIDVATGKNVLQVFTTTTGGNSSVDYEVFCNNIIPKGNCPRSFPKGTTGTATTVICTGNALEDVSDNEFPTEPTSIQVYANNLLL